MEYEKKVTIEVTIHSDDEQFRTGHLSVSKVVADGKEAPGGSARHGSQWEVLSTESCSLAVVLTDY